MEYILFPIFILKLNTNATPSIEECKVRHLCGRWWKIIVDNNVTLFSFFVYTCYTIYSITQSWILNFIEKCLQYHVQSTQTAVKILINTCNIREIFPCSIRLFQLLLLTWLTQISLIARVKYFTHTPQVQGTTVDS